MKLLAKIVVTTLLTFSISRLIYSSDWADAWYRSPTGQRVYEFLARFFGMNGANQRDNLIFLVIAGISLIAALIMVYISGRIIRRRETKAPH